MTQLTVGAVDVYPLRAGAAGWEALLLRRAPGVRCTGAWEVVHGHILPGEPPSDAALRELREETGLEAARLYNVTVNPFYLHRADTVLVSIVFAAVTAGDDPMLGVEHDDAAWLPLAEAARRASWPRTHHTLQDIGQLLTWGDAGPLEDVLRVR